jgi:hypothetical protein
LTEAAFSGKSQIRAHVKHILRSAVFVIATVYFIVDAVFLKVAAPIARWMARKRIFIRLRKWIGSLRPYPSLALFAVPVVLLEPVKPVAAYLVASGNFSVGMMILIVGELLKLIIIERLFKLCRLKLLKIPIFAWGYGHWRDGVNWIVSMKAWQAARVWILLIKRRVQKYIMQMKSSKILSRPYRQ